MSARRLLLLLLLCCSIMLPVLAQEQPARTFALTDSVTLPGVPVKVFAAITGDISPWWDHTFSGKPYRLLIEPKLGGRFLEQFNEQGDGVIHATVTYVEQGKGLRFVGPLGFAGKAVNLTTTIRLVPAGSDSTRLLLDVHAAGEIEPGTGSTVHMVWRHFLFERLKPYLEGRPMGRP